MNRIRKRLFANAKEKRKKFCRARQPDSDADFCTGTIEPCNDCGCAGVGKYHCYAWENAARKGSRTVKKAEQLVSNHPELVDYIDEVQAQLNWEEILNQLVTFFRIGANSMLSSTISVATGIVSGVGYVFSSALFCACYILLQQEFLKRQMKKLILRLSEGKARKPFSANLRADVSHVFKFPDRAVPRGGDSGDDVLRFHDDSAVPFAVLVGVLIAFIGTDSPFFGGICRLCSRHLPDSDGKSLAGSCVCRAVPCAATD